MNSLPTEQQLSKKEDYRKFADHNEKSHKDIGLIDIQDGKIIHLNTKYVLNDEIIKSIDGVIEKWLLDKNADNRIEISIDVAPTGNDMDLKTFRLPFERYYVNFQYCSNGCDQWVLVKCALHGYPKIYSKHLGTFLLHGGFDRDTMHFVHNQVFKAKERYQDDFVEETTFL